MNQKCSRTTVIEESGDELSELGRKSDSELNVQVILRILAALELTQWRYMMLDQSSLGMISHFENTHNSPSSGQNLAIAFPHSLYSPQKPKRNNIGLCTICTLHRVRLFTEDIKIMVFAVCSRYLSKT